MDGEKKYPTAVGHASGKKPGRGDEA